MHIKCSEWVNADKNTPLNEWIEAESGEKTPNGKVKSKLGELAYRPAWHLSDYPIATHIGKKDKNGVIVAQKKDTVWALCEYSDNVNYQEEANANSISAKGKFDARKTCLSYIPKDGYYRYKTNPNMMGDWILAGAIKVIRVLTDEEADTILAENNIKSMSRDGGRIKFNDYGFYYWFLNKNIV